MISLSYRTIFLAAIQKRSPQFVVRVCEFCVRVRSNHQSPAIPKGVRPNQVATMSSEWYW
ncbi:MAG: hypothetical protein MK110_05975 [Fuerstiella sp.]|nr:hypothetical protein [Fuerstiella sp.]